MEEWRTIAEMAKELNLGETTVRRYTKLFDTYLQKRKLGRATKYSKEAQKTIQDIAELYDQGYGTVEIEDILSRQYSKIIDVDNTGGEVVAVDDGDMEVKISSIVNIIKEQQRQIETLKSELEKTQTQITATAEERDKAILVKMREIMQEKEKERQGLPWWKKILS